MPVNIYDNEFHNWLKGVLALNTTREALCGSVTEGFEGLVSTFQEDDLNQFFVCLKENEIQSFKQRTYSKKCGCGHKECEPIFKKLKEHDACSTLPKKWEVIPSIFMNSCSTKCDKHGLIWSMVKLFMFVGAGEEIDQQRCLDNLDISKVIKMMKNCRLFIPDGSLQFYDEVLELRNVLMHSPNNRMSEVDLRKKLESARKLLEELGVSKDNKDCIQYLKELEESNFSITYQSKEYIGIMEEVKRAEKLATDLHSSIDDNNKESKDNCKRLQMILENVCSKADLKGVNPQLVCNAGAFKSLVKRCIENKKASLESDEILCDNDDDKGTIKQLQAQIDQDLSDINEQLKKTDDQEVAELIENLNKEVTTLGGKCKKMEKKGKRLKDHIVEERKKFIAEKTEAFNLRMELARMEQNLIAEEENNMNRDLKQFGTGTGSDKKKKMLVLSINLRTDFSNYAFSFKHDYQIDPTKIDVNTSWLAGSIFVVSLFSPTAVLFDENKKFHSFGYEAENTYADLALDNDHHKWFFFKRLILPNKKITLDVEIEDVNKRKMKAIDVFGAAIKHLRDHLLDLMKKRGTEVENEDIHYVLPVSAALSISAKQFMREAAYKADIYGRQLSIILDPDAASLYCQALPNERMHGSEGAQFDVSKPGTKYMVVDLRAHGDIKWCAQVAGLQLIGRGHRLWDTAYGAFVTYEDQLLLFDASITYFTVHERQADGGLRELHIASCGAWGGTKVDEEFYGLLIRLIGGPVYQKFVDENKSDHLELQRELELIKYTITPQSSGVITITVPVVLLKTFEDETKEDIKEAIECSPYSGKITWKEDKMRIDAQVFKNLYKPCTDKIVNHIKELLKVQDVQGTNIVLMVGMFSESVMLQDAIMKALPKCKVIIPDEASLTVLKGAVVFGHRPVAITSRVSKYTYGISISPPFDPNIHPEDHRVAAGGIDRCRDIFKKYIYKDEEVKVGEGRLRIHVTDDSNQSEILLKIFASPKKDPQFVDDDDTEYLGKVVVKLPDCEDKIRVHVVMMFGETELIVNAIELSQNTKYRAYFEYM